MSFLLSIFCLGKDMLNRWKTHFSGALARVCVVFLLTITALIVLSSFVVSEKVVAKEVARTGGNVVVAQESFFGDPVAEDVLPRAWIVPPAGTRQAVFDEVFVFAKVRTETYPIILYDISGTRFFPEIKYAPHGIFFLPKQGIETEAFLDWELAGFPFSAKVLSGDGRETLSAVYATGAVFVPASSFARLKENGFTRRTIFEAEKADSVIIRQIETALRERICLDERQAFVRSSLKFLERLERIRADQEMWRLAIPLGIVFIIGILLISISSVEFRHNEYVYALMNSFGVNRILLVASFIVENAILVFAAFFLAIFTFFRCLPLLIKEAFKIGGNVTLEAAELSSDFNIIAGSLGVCIVISVIPVAASAFREIGKVLK